MRQVGRADEQHVRARLGGDRVRVGDGRGVLDLEDAERHVVQRPDLGVADATEALPADAERHPALALGREAHPGQGLRRRPSADSTRGTMSPPAPRSSAREMRRRSLRSTRTSAVAPVVPTA